MKEQSKIKYSDLWGLREEKYQFLESHYVKNTKWRSLEIEKFEQEFRKTRWSKKYKNGFYFFTPKMAANIIEYGDFYGVDEIFKNYNAGIATGKDDFLVDYKKDELKIRLSFNDKDVFKMMLKQYKISDNLIKSFMDELEKADLDSQIKNYAYRPFDNRFVIYNSKIIQRARREIMDNFLDENLGLVMTNTSNIEQYNEIFVVNSISDKHLTGHQTYVFPLYLYNQSKKSLIFSGQKSLDLAGAQKKLDGSEEKTPNIKKEFFDQLKNTYGKKVSPEDIFYYIYAILYSNKYRQKYQEFLKIDFPRAPFTKDYKLFKDLSKLGEELAELHLLKSKKLNKASAKFCGAGLNEVKKREYNKKEKRLYINNEQYFGGIEPEVWDYYIGGYQVLDKWIKDRIGRSLSREDVEHYLKVVTTLKLTIELQEKIDRLYWLTEEEIKVVEN